MNHGSMTIIERNYYYHYQLEKWLMVPMGKEEDLLAIGLIVIRTSKKPDRLYYHEIITRRFHEICDEEDDEFTANP